MISYKLLLEALTPKQIKIADGKLGGNKYNPEKEHDGIFSLGTNRINIPLEYHTDLKGGIRNKIRNILNSEGYDIEDYKEGLASQEYIDKLGNHRKKIVKIGKILQNKGHVNELKEFTYDPMRSSESKDLNHDQYNITLSRDKYDIAGMTSGRDWERQSCMRLPSESDSKGGEKYEHIKDDLKHNSLIAYLTKKGDDEIEAPLGRILIKKYTSDKKIDGKYHHIWRPDRTVYGNVPEGFFTSLKNYMAEKYPAKEGVGYSLAKGLYPESETEIKPIQRGLVEKNNNIYHYNQNGELHDYEDENGVLQPAVKSLYFSDRYSHYKNGKLHREGDLPASVDGKNIVYVINGNFHRDGDYPAVQGKDDSSSYYRHGILHRPYGKPARIDEKSVGYYEYGLLHREGDLPAYVHKDKNTIVKDYKIRGEYHRDTDKPSFVRKSLDKNGNVINSEIRYYKHGNLHREGDLPAHVSYSNHMENSDNELLENNKVLTKTWYLNGEIARNDSENNPTKTISINGKIIRKEYSHDNPNKPILIEKYPSYIKTEYGNGVIEKADKNENLIIHPTRTIKSGNSYHNATTIESNIENFKGIKLPYNNGIYKFGDNHLIRAYHGYHHLLKKINGIWHTHRIDRNLKVEDLDDVRQMRDTIHSVSDEKYTKDDGNIHLANKILGDIIDDNNDHPNKDLIKKLKAD